MIVYAFTYLYILPGSDLDGEPITVEALDEAEAFARASRYVAQVSPRIRLQLSACVPTNQRRSA